MSDTGFFRAVLDRVRSKVEKLESLCEDIPNKLESQRATREHWYSWHNLWKKAWISNNETDLSSGELEKLKEETSATRRYKAIDF